MKIAGTFRLVKTNIETGKTEEIEAGNIVTNNYYNLLRDGSNSSIGFYLWVSPYDMEKSRRRRTTEATSQFMNDAYGYMPSEDWFARYVLAEENQPGYFESRCRLDPPDSGTRTIKSIMMGNKQPRSDNITGLLPEYSVQTVIDERTPGTITTFTKMSIYAFVTLETPCTQSTIEIYDIYYRIIFDNNYADINLSETGIELIGKQSTAKMPTINQSGSYLYTTPLRVPNLSKMGPVNFITSVLTRTDVNITDGSLWYDYTPACPASKSTNSYVTNYSVDMTKDIHVGKVVSSIYPNGYNSTNFISGQKPIRLDGDPTIGNTHSHNNTAPYPYFDPSNLATGIGECTMESTTVPGFPEWIEVMIQDSGSFNTATYKMKTMPFTGTAKNSYTPIPVEIPHIGQIVANYGSWRYGIHYQGTEDMHGFLTYRAGTHPGLSGLTYDSGTNSVAIPSRMEMPGYAGFRELNDNELIGYDKDGISILSLTGSVRSINKFKSGSFIPENIVQVTSDIDTGYIYAACTVTGLYRLNSTLTVVDKIVPTGGSPTDKCYGFDLYQNNMAALFDSGMYISTDSGVNWTQYAVPDYANNGLDGTKVIGIRADLSSVTPNIFILFDNKDGSYSTDKTYLEGAWWSPSIFNIVYDKPSMAVYGVSASFLGIDYVEFINGTFYATFHSAASNTTKIMSMLFNQVGMTQVVSYGNTTTEGIPRFWKKNAKDYVTYVTGSSVYIHNITDGVSEGGISSYGLNSYSLSVALSGWSPFYYATMSNGLVIYRGTSNFSYNISNGSSEHNIRNDVLRETAALTVTKIMNPFFGTSMQHFVEKEYGWDGSQFSTISTNSKAIGSGSNTFNGIQINFSGLGGNDDFIAGERYTTVRVDGFLKDNASLAKLFFSNSNYIKSEQQSQAGTITPSTTFYQMGKFEYEEANVKYDTPGYYVFDSRLTPFDFFRHTKLPQEAGTWKMTIDHAMESGIAVVFSAYQSTSTYRSFVLCVYRRAGLIRARVGKGYVSYKRADMLIPDTAYPEYTLADGDTVEVQWETGSQQRAFTMKVNGSAVHTGLNFDSSSSGKNNSQLYINYALLTDDYPTAASEIAVPIPEIRYESTSTLICLPLESFIEDTYGLSVNDGNYGVGGDMHITINGVLSENNGIHVPPTVDSVIYYSPRTIYIGDCAANNYSGTLYFSRDDEGKAYTAEYFYYKDTE